jgi:membrane-bound lytic murein transglycosylase F
MNAMVAACLVGTLLLSSARTVRAQAPASDSVAAAAATETRAKGARPPRAGKPRMGERFAQAVREREAARRQDEYDEAFRTYTKRFFGPAHDWRLFKAQGMAESDLIPTAKSRVGARGIMQLMPSTFSQIRKARPEFRSIEDPRWNIAAGIMHDRYLWTLYPQLPDDERHRFMFAAYNAGEGTIRRAQGVAQARQLDAGRWEHIETIAPAVQRWRYRETLGYVRRIEANHDRLRTAADGSSTRAALADAIRRGPTARRD